ncbi:MAG: DUF4272 domain-containing protein [Clostridiales bacterium]|nr:DUF4272 domain-containing protein [Clostridiales bacterium]
MGLFDKIFRRNKNVIELKEEDFSEPMPETEPEKAAAGEPEPVINLDGKVYFGAASMDEACMKTRFALRNAARGFSESDEGFEIGFRERISAKACVSAFDSADGTGYRLTYEENAALKGFGFVLDVIFSGTDENVLREESRKLISEIKEDLGGLGIFEGESAGLAVNVQTGEKAEEAKTIDFKDLPAGSRGKSIAGLRTHGIFEPVSVGEELLGEENYPRNDSDVLKRAAGLLYTALTAMSAPVPGQTLPVGRYSALLAKLNERYAVKDTLTAKEAEYIKQPGVAGKATMTLKTEAAALLLWYLGLWELPWADTPSDINELAGALSPAGMEETLSRSRPRSRGEIEDMYDLTICQHWLTVRMSLNELSSKALDPDIIYARHYALNWLMRVGGKKKWDSVVPTT